MNFIQNTYQNVTWTNPCEFRFTPGDCPIIKLETTNAPPDLLSKPHIMWVSGRMALDYFGERNSDPAHVVLQTRSDLSQIGGAGAYVGHGIALGKLFADQNGDVVRSHIETWFGRSGGTQGANLLIPSSMSEPLPDLTELRFDFFSTAAPNGYKYARQIIGPLAHPPKDTGDIEDNNADVDMWRQSLALTTIFNPKPGTDGGMVRIWNISVEWMPAGVVIPTTH